MVIFLMISSLACIFKYKQSLFEISVDCMIYCELLEMEPCWSLVSHFNQLQLNLT